MLSGRQVAGAVAALALALALFTPSRSSTATTRGCPYGFGADARPGDHHHHHHRRGVPTPSSGSSRGDARVFAGAKFWIDDGVGDGEWADAIAVTRSGRVLASGNVSRVTALAGDAAEIVDLAAGDDDDDGSTTERLERLRFVLPGLHDAHLHLVSGGFRLRELDLSDVDSKDAFVKRVEDAARALPVGTDDAWVLGGGWDETRWGGEPPVADWFGDLGETTNVWLLRADAHVGVASNAALRAAGVTSSTRDPDGGVVGRRDDGSGRPNGVLRDNAMTLVRSRIPKTTDEARVAAFQRAFKHLLSLGITTVCDFGDVNALAGSSVKGATERVWDDLALLEAMDARGELPTRVNAYLPLADWERVRDARDAAAAAPRAWFEDVAPDDERYESYGDSGRLRVAGAKAFVDGSLGAGTALFRAPYADDRSNFGVAVSDVAELTRRVVAADAAGVQVAVHAIGDGAVDVALRAVEKATEANGARPSRRFRIEHAQHLPGPSAETTPARMRRAGAIASVQPAHMALDVALVRAKLGEERAARSYAFRSFLDAGVALAGGSDWPVVAADAFAAMRAAVARPGWDASQKLTWKEALRMYTTGAAETSALRGAVGALTRGAFADFVVVEGWNPWMDGNDEAAEASASPTRVVSTYVGGRCAHGCESAAIEH